jgi:hypothetical protein
MDYTDYLLIKAGVLLVLAFIINFCKGLSGRG